MAERLTCLIGRAWELIYSTCQGAGAAVTNKYIDKNKHEQIFPNREPRPLKRDHRSEYLKPKTKLDRPAYRRTLPLFIFVRGGAPARTSHCRQMTAHMKPYASNACGVHMGCRQDKHHKAAFDEQRAALSYALCSCVGEQSMRQRWPLTFKGHFVHCASSADHMRLTHMKSYALVIAPSESYIQYLYLLQNNEQVEQCKPR